MTPFEWIAGVFAALIAAGAAVFRIYYMPSTDTLTEALIKTPAVSPKEPPRAPLPPQPTVESLQFDTPRHAWHSVRVMCDDAGLSVTEKNLICACVYQESQFKNSALGRNIVNGKVVSTDWGLCQINDHYHCGPGKDFPSAEYVVANPEKAVAFLLRMYKAGLLKQWVSYSSGAYQKWLSPTSKMWALKA